MIVVTDTTKLEGDYVAMNSSGLGGANCHILFKGNNREKIGQNGTAQENLPSLVLWSGRTEKAVNAIFDDIRDRPLDDEYVALLHNTQVQTSNANTFRGFGIFTNDASRRNAACLMKNINYFNDEKRPVTWVFTGVGSQWLGMISDLMKIPVFAKAINRCHKTLTPKGIDLKKIIASSDKDTYDCVLNTYVGIIAIEVALTDVLKEIGLEPDFIIGHSVGELGCAYADGCLSSEEAILAAHARGVASKEVNVIHGAMAAIGLSHKQVKEVLPEDVDIACHNGVESCTISGPAESVQALVEKFRGDNIFAKEVACSGVPFHSRYIKKVGEKLKERLIRVISGCKKRSAKWISSTYPQSDWHLEESQSTSAEYFSKNLLNPVLFEEACEMLPKNALTIEIAPHGLLKAILKKNLKEGKHLSLTERGNGNGSLFLLESLGT